MNQCCSACLRIVCSTAKWPNGSVTQLPGSNHFKVGHGSFPKEALSHDVTRCAELHSPSHHVSGPGRFLVRCESAHVPICSTAVEEAQASQGALLKDAREYACAQAVTCARLCLPVLFLQCLSALLVFPRRSAALICSILRPHLYKVCKTLPAVPLAPAGLCSMLSQEERIRKQSWGKALDHLRAGAKQFQVQNLLDAC